MRNKSIVATFLLSTLACANAISAEATLVPDIEGRAVVDNAGTEIGDVDVVARRGEETVAIIGLDGSMKEVAVPMSSINVTTDGTVFTDFSLAELEQYEDVDPMDYSSIDRNAETERNLNNGNRNLNE